MYKKTELWKRAASQAEAVGSVEAWTRLESEYGKFWDRANRIAENIATELPGLTLHNQAHLEAVWDVADQLAGEKFPMTPLETFVFGGAVLLHDLAHSVTAYQGGIDAVRKTPAWRQAVLWRLDLDDDAPDPSDQEIEHPGDEIERAALFDTLRTLHAEQAETLYDTPKRLPDGDIYLIDDIELRRHLGPIIGKIAASHHWDREKLRPLLRKQIGPLGWAPKLGSIQPVKLACLLRCADACQIDQRRAPDFDLALQAPIGMSRKHWQAQNRLTPPTIEGDSLAFTSIQAFDQDEADVWWIAHDLTQIAHRELQECAALMRDQNLPPLRVTGVAGASDPAKLAEDYVETEGWTPVDASLRVSNPRRMVEMFGGEQYYGEGALWVPLRELLQNGIDAIEARRLLEPENSGYEGRILVEQVAGELDGKTGYWLHVSDDGIGMSERVLTRTLVDFGHSAKTSGELTEEFSELRGKRVPTIGQFGIGFFSVLMLSDHVLVQSRPFDGARDTTKKLRFAWGAECRPLLLDGEPGELGGMSTKVSLFIERATFDRFTACLGPHDIVDGKEVGNESLTKLVQMVAPLPNCQLAVCEPDSNCQLVRSPAMYNNEQALDWLTSIYARDEDENLEKAARYLTPMHDHVGITIGWATFNFAEHTWDDRGAGFRTEKGLCLQAWEDEYQSRDSNIIGVLPASASGPKRDNAAIPEGKAFEAWRSVVLKTLRPSAFSHQECDSLSKSIYNLGDDPLEFAQIAMVYSDLKLDQCYHATNDFIDYSDSCFANEIAKNDICNTLEIEWQRIKKDSYFIITNHAFRIERNLGSNFFSLPNVIENIIYDSRHSDDYKDYNWADIDDDFCLLGCLRRRCEQRGLVLTLTPSEREFLGFRVNDKFGKSGEIHTNDALQLRIRPAA